jgi:hypothetical protein
MLDPQTLGSFYSSNELSGNPLTLSRLNSVNLSADETTLHANARQIELAGYGSTELLESQLIESASRITSDDCLYATSSEVHSTTSVHGTDRLTGLQDNAIGVATNSDYRVNNTVQGRLDYTDLLNPTRAACYRDDYLLNSASRGQIRLNLDSNQFDTYLQVVDATTGRVVTFDDDSGPGTNSQLIFTV